jgi:hypothetical protein
MMTSFSSSSLRLERSAIAIGIILVAATASTSKVAAQGTPPIAGAMTLERLNREIRPRIRRLAEAALDGRRPDPADESERFDRRINRQAMEGAYGEAKLAREIAEIGVKAYTDGTALMERMAIEDEVGIAKSALADARERVVKLEAVLEKIKALKVTQIREMKEAYEIRRSYRAAQLEIPKLLLALEQAQHRLERFGAYQVPRRTKELLIEVEKARAGELKAEEIFKTIGEDLEQGEGQVVVDENRKAPDWKPVLSTLAEAVGLEGTLRAQLKQGPPADAEARRAWEATLVSRSSKIEAALGRAEQLSADIEFGELGRKARELARATSAESPKPEK